MKSLSKFFAIIIIVSFGAKSYSQDSTSIRTQIEILSSRIDSLEKIISSANLDSNSFSTSNKTDFNKTTKEDTIDSDLLKSLTDIISFEGEIQSSKRERVNELLSALRSAPGILNFKGDVTTSMQWKTGNDQFSSAVASFDIFALSQLGDNIKFFANIEAIGGNGPNSSISSYSSLNGDAGSTQSSSGLDLMHILEAWAEFEFFGNWVNIVVGKLDLTNYFDVNAAANDETRQFLSGAFVNSTAFPVPQNSAGIKVNANLANLILFQFACSSEDNSGDQIFNQLFKIVSTQLNLMINEDITGEYHIFTYKSGLVKDASGYGISISNSLGPLRLFGRWNINNTNYSKIFPYKDFWSVGLDINTSLFENAFILGLAGGKVNPFQTNLKREFISEIYFSYQFNDWIFFSPHFQLVKNAFGSNSELLLLGFRSHFNF